MGNSRTLQFSVHFKGIFAHWIYNLWVSSPYPAPLTRAAPRRRRDIKLHTLQRRKNTWLANVFNSVFFAQYRQKMKEGKNNFRPMNLEILVNVSRIRTFHGRHGLLHICFKFSVLACLPPAVISTFYDDSNDLWSVGIELESNITQTTAVVVQQGGGASKNYNNTKVFIFKPHLPFACCGIRCTRQTQALLTTRRTRQSDWRSARTSCNFFLKRKK